MTDKYTDLANKLIDANPCFYDATDSKEPSVAFKRDEGVKAIAALLRQEVDQARTECLRIAQAELNKQVGIDDGGANAACRIRNSIKDIK